MSLPNILENKAAGRLKRILDIFIQLSEINEPSSWVVKDKCQFNLNEPDKNIPLPSIYLHNIKLSTTSFFEQKRTGKKVINGQISNNTP